MQLLVYEISLTLRRLFRRPRQAALWLITFWVSIGLAALSWALFHTIFLKNPEFDPAGTLLWIHQRPQAESATVERSTYREFLAWRDQQTAFSDFDAAVLYRSVFLTLDGGTERFSGANLSAAILRGLDARPLLGRIFTPEDDLPQSEPTILLSYALWQSHFSGDPAVVGKPLTVDSKTATIIGVMPRDFRFPNDQQVWLPLGFHPAFPSINAPVLDVVARLKPGHSLESGRAELQRISALRETDTTFARVSLHPAVEPFRQYYVSPNLRLSAATLLILSLVFVLVSCVNTANLVLIEFTSRRTELATLAALGIPRMAPVRILTLKLLIVTTAAAALGILGVLWLAPLAYAALTLWDAPYWLHFALEPHHFLVAGALSIVATTVATTGPSLYLFQTRPDQMIRRGAGNSRASQHYGWRRAAMIVQVSLLTVLAVFAALLVRSSVRLSQMTWGFDPEPVYNIRTGVRRDDFPKVLEQRTAFERALEEVRRVPGVSHAALAHELPGYDNHPNCFYSSRREDLASNQPAGRAMHFIVTDEFFATLSIPLIAGETFPRDSLSPDVGPDNAVITRGLAQRLWPGENAVGRTLYMREGYNVRTGPRAVSVRGVVEDLRAGGPLNTEHEAIFTATSRETQMFYFLLVRGSQGVPVERTIRAAVKKGDPRLPMYFGASFARQLEVATKVVHLTTRLTLLFATVAALLCAVGVYTVTVSQLLQETRAFGIRLALGGEAQSLWRRFVAGNLTAVIAGIVAGLGCAALTTPLLAALLTGITPFDAVAFTGAAFLIAIVAGLASVPSWLRLRRIDPAECLRSL